MANKEKGYIYLYRSIQDNPLWLEHSAFDRRSAFIDMLFMANYTEKELILRGGTKKTIKRGQFHTSIKGLSIRWGWSEKKTKRYLSLLSDLGMVHTDSTTHGTTVTIVNYGDFQDLGQTKGRTKGTTNDRTGDLSDDPTDDRTNDLTDGTRLNKSNTSNTSNKRNKKKAAPLSPNAGKPKYHIIDEYEYWYEDGMWCRELINKGDANGDISG